MRIHKAVAIYVRVSTEQQAKEGYSIEAQKSNLVEFIKEQEWKLYDIYSDEGISGKNIEDRSEVKRLIQDIKNKLIDVVVLYKFDRLTRDMSDTEEFIKLIRNHDIQVYTLSGGVIDVSSASGRFMVRINGAVAQLEREQTIERIKIAFKEKVREGYSLCSSITSYGYNRKKGEKIQTVNKKEALIVKKIFKWFIEGYNMLDISNTLNSLNIATKQSNKNKKHLWSSKTIKNILTNPNYIGKVRYGINKNDGFVIDGLHDPIIDEKTFLSAQNKLYKIKNIIKTNYPKDDAYFSLVLMCDKCKSRLLPKRSTRNNKQYISYICSNKKNCNFRSISHNKVNKMFLDYLERINPIINNSIKYLKNDQIKINTKKALINFNKKNKELIRLYTSKVITLKELMEFKNEIQREKDVINTMSSVQEIEISNNIPRTIYEHFLLFNNFERQQFINNFIDCIRIGKDDINATIIVEFAQIET